MGAEGRASARPGHGEARSSELRRMLRAQGSDLFLR